jgi:phosphate transport system substrate-binding protein
MRRSISLLLSILPILGLSCNSIELQQRHLVMSGSPSFEPLMRDLAERFQALHPGVRVDVSTAPADRTITETREGLVDVALLGREVRSVEGLRGVEIARDGLAFIAHRGNPVSSLDERQLVGLLTRTYTDWSDVNGNGGRVVVVGMAEGRDTRAALLRRLRLESPDVPLDIALYRNEQIIAAVANNPKALGYISLAAVGNDQTVRIIPQSGVSPTPESVRDGRYPCTRPLVLAARAQTGELAAAFVEFGQSPEVSDLLERHGFAPKQP